MAGVGLTPGHGGVGELAGAAELAISRGRRHQNLMVQGMRCSPLCRSPKRPEREDDQRFRWSGADVVGLAGLEPADLILIRYRGLSAVRTGVFPGRWRASGAKGCVLTARPDPAHRRDAVAAGNGMPTNPSPAGRWGCRVGAAAPSSGDDRGQAACPSRARRLVRVAARTASPPAKRQRSDQHRQRSNEPAGLSAWLGGHGCR